MRLIIILIFVALMGVSRDVYARGRGGAVSVRGYFTKSGKYVAPHFRSAPDHSKLNNWSTIGNINPYTGKRGSKNVWPYALK